MRYAKCTDLRRRLSELLDEVERGTSVILLRRGQPVARLVPMEEPPPTPSWKRPIRTRTLSGESIVDTLRRERDAS